MVKRTIISEGSITVSILYACEVLGCSRAAIEARFGNENIKVINYEFYDGYELSLEVALENISLICLINDNAVCDSTILFLNELSDLRYYISHLNRIAEYNYENHLWIYRDRRICVDIQEADCFLVFT